MIRTLAYFVALLGTSIISAPLSGVVSVTLAMFIVNTAWTE